MRYSVYEFFTKEEIERDWLVSILNDYGFEGYEETTDSLKAFVPVDLTGDAAVAKILSDNEFNHIHFSSQILEDKNWNEEWEKNFEPVIVAGKVAIRAPFHSPITSEFEIVIEPKMSFGTGHHATTASVIELMLQEDFINKSVLDFGSGTGVLAILAEKLKAVDITAIDHEEWAFNNCVENMERNGCVHIKAIRGDDSFLFDRKFDIILANINRNVILQNLASWKNLLEKNGVLMVSGILLSDEKDIVHEGTLNQMNVKRRLLNNGWLAIAFKHV